MKRGEDINYTYLMKVTPPVPPRQTGSNRSSVQKHRSLPMLLMSDAKFALAAHTPPV